ncbi:MAG: HAMP domain-containing protein [Candidatus Omnitrophica bacterium]|nr:HAMP domain-containing protein [Candidatus Omnitrophota bacterium]
MNQIFPPQPARQGLRLKFLVIVFISLGVSGLISVGLIIPNELRSMGQILTNHGKNIGRYIADLCADPILNKDYLQLDNIVNKITNDPNVVYTVIYDDRHRLITNMFASINFSTPEAQAALAALPKNSALADFIIQVRRGGAVHDVFMSISFGTEVLGDVVIGISDRKAHEEGAKMLRRIFWAHCAAFLAALLFLSRLQKIIVQPIVDLAALMARVSKDQNYSRRAAVNSRDELGVLQNSFNDMLEQIERRDQELEIHRRHLQEEVNERVVELAVANQQLLQAEKMASVGQLAAGVAHEINNPIGFIRSNLYSLNQYIAKIRRMLDKYCAVEKQLTGLADPAAARAAAELAELKTALDLDYIIADLEKLIAETEEGAERVKKIVSSLMAFSRPDAEKSSRVDIHNLIDEALNMVRNEFQHKLNVRKEYGVLEPLQCYPQQLVQVFVNLFINAAQATSGSGTLTIKTYREENFCCVAVEDTGYGIPAENLPRIFDPFFTTKEVGVGTGLGLSIVYRIMENHKGNVGVKSEVGKGTVFTLRIPVDRQKEEG